MADAAGRRRRANAADKTPAMSCLFQLNIFPDLGSRRSVIALIFE